MNVEEDEAGKLRAFRAKFGRGWDAEAAEYKDEPGDGSKASGDQQAEESLLDLISGYGQWQDAKGDSKTAKELAKSGTSKGGKK